MERLFLRDSGPAQSPRWLLRPPKAGEPPVGELSGPVCPLAILKTVSSPRVIWQIKFNQQILVFLNKFRFLHFRFSASKREEHKERKSRKVKILENWPDLLQLHTEPKPRNIERVALKASHLGGPCFHLVPPSW